MNHEIDLRSMREELGMTQGGLAQALRVGLNTVWRWERADPPSTLVYYALRGLIAERKKEATA